MQVTQIAGSIVNVRVMRSQYVRKIQAAWWGIRHITSHDV